MANSPRTCFPVSNTGAPVTGKLKVKQKRYKRLYFLMKPKDIADYIVHIFNYWRIPIKYIGKSPCNSWYVKLLLGTVNDPKSIHIRISDHDSISEDSRYDYDVLCSFWRSGSHGIIPLTYIRLIELLAAKFGKDIPHLCKVLLPFRKQHSITLQRNHKNRLMVSPKGSRLFIA